jgi:hypothetical protein
LFVLRIVLRVQGVAPVGAWIREVPLPDSPEDRGQEAELPTHQPAKDSSWIPITKAIQVEHDSVFHAPVTPDKPSPITCPAKQPLCTKVDSGLPLQVPNPDAWNKTYFVTRLSRSKAKIHVLIKQQESLIEHSDSLDCAGPNQHCRTHDEFNLIGLRHLYSVAQLGV